MNETILINEGNNKGKSIFLYSESEASVWSAYGPSAYALRLLAKFYDLESLRSYSDKLNLPRTTITDQTLYRIFLLCEIDSECHAEDNAVYLNLHAGTKAKSEPGSINPTDEFARLSDLSKTIVVRLSTEFDWGEYENWCRRLKYERDHPELIVVETPVSKFVPKDKYIPDGMSSFSRQIKRCGDFILSSISLVLFSPLFLYCYVVVKREDGGPALYRQERIGRFGRPFTMFKFRTMNVDAEKNGPQLSNNGGKDDPRLTRIGAFLRAHHLDELPQLWNVFRGDMAFIGPRPERNFYIEQILEHDKRYTYLYQIRPGVTSYATLYNGYTDSMEKMLRRLEYDLYYLSHRSWMFDARILWNTFQSIVLGKKF